MSQNQENACTAIDAAVEDAVESTVLQYINEIQAGGDGSDLDEFGETYGFEDFGWTDDDDDYDGRASIGSATSPQDKQLLDLGQDDFDIDPLSPFDQCVDVDTSDDGERDFNQPVSLLETSATETSSSLHVAPSPLAVQSSISTIPSASTHLSHNDDVEVLDGAPVSWVELKQRRKPRFGFRFMDFPAETRDLIYDKCLPIRQKLTVMPDNTIRRIRPQAYVLKRRGRRDSDTLDRERNCPNLAILHLNKQTSKEALTVLYGKAELSLKINELSLHHLPGRPRDEARVPYTIPRGWSDSIKFRVGLMGSIRLNVVLQDSHNAKLIVARAMRQLCSILANRSPFILHLFFRDNTGRRRRKRASQRPSGSSRNNYMVVDRLRSLNNVYVETCFGLPADYMNHLIITLQRKIEGQRVPRRPWMISLAPAVRRGPKRPSITHHDVNSADSEQHGPDCRLGLFLSDEGHTYIDRDAQRIRRQLGNLVSEDEGQQAIPLAGFFTPPSVPTKPNQASVDDISASRQPPKLAPSPFASTFSGLIDRETGAAKPQTSRVSSIPESDSTQIPSVAAGDKRKQKVDKLHIQKYIKKPEMSKELAKYKAAFRPRPSRRPRVQQHAKVLRVPPPEPCTSSDEDTKPDKSLTQFEAAMASGISKLPIDSSLGPFARAGVTPLINPSTELDFPVRSQPLPMLTQTRDVYVSRFESGKRPISPAMDEKRVPRSEKVELKDEIPAERLQKLMHEAWDRITLADPDSSSVSALDPASAAAATTTAVRDTHAAEATAQGRSVRGSRLAAGKARRQEPAAPDSDSESDDYADKEYEDPRGKRKATRPARKRHRPMQSAAIGATGFIS
ncbi:MAG: hypothetical protein M1825_003719 [Sarcosagium campestre]|nr:MAG: hypothetical protein M1825_003719 [Sarcosagium campestre]